MGVAPAREDLALPARRRGVRGGRSLLEHDGVDWHAIELALDRNLEAGEISVGGSTITQQLAKNLFLSPSRSLIRKLREMLIAFSLEDHLSKQRILELYLNVAEWGDGIFGAEAAAKHWFGHSAQSLSPSEAARLAIALPNPFTRNPKVDTEQLRKKAVRIIRLLRMQGLVNAAQERAALDEVGAHSARVRPDGSLPPEAMPPITAPTGDSSPPVTAPTPEPSLPVTEPSQAPAEPAQPEPTPEPATPPPETPPAGP
jgi:monofunctional biosynthetic peptidoglycan transglycosylase